MYVCVWLTEWPLRANRRTHARLLRRERRLDRSYRLLSPVVMYVLGDDGELMRERGHCAHFSHCFRRDPPRFDDEDFQGFPINSRLGRCF
jgi:hypothetical protein